MSSSAANVLRYTALGFGIFYGFTHQRSITAANKAAAEKREYEHKLSLIQKAKEEYAKKHAPATSATTTTGGLNQDPTSPNFDLESYISALTDAKI
ncbi:ATP synthase subunit E [Naviculisporaceae sp. PSN 640]